MPRAVIDNHDGMHALQEHAAQKYDLPRNCTQKAGRWL